MVRLTTYGICLLSSSAMMRQKIRVTVCHRLHQQRAILAKRYSARYFPANIPWPMTLAPTNEAISREIMRKKNFIGKKNGINFRIPVHRPSNFVIATPSNFNREYLACHCHISNLKSDFFVRERDLSLTPPPCAAQSLKNDSIHSLTSLSPVTNPHYLAEILINPQCITCLCIDPHYLAKFI